MIRHGEVSRISGIRAGIAFMAALACFGLRNDAQAQDDIRPIIEAEKNHLDEVDTDTRNASTTVAEARIRARMLHEALHGALQVMHREYFREDEKLTLPAKSLEEVFLEMSRRQNVKLRWIAVNTKAMSITHKPKTDFENAAVKALASGKPEFEAIDSGFYRYAGTIRLSAHCLKCHASRRTSNDERAAGLTITIPLGRQKNNFRN